MTVGLCAYKEMNAMAVADKLKALQIKANIIADKSIGLMEINIDVHDGIATLTGEVENDDQKQKAEELAYQIDGIIEVENEIQVIHLTNLLTGCDELMGAHLGYGPMEGSAGSTTFSLSGQYSTPGPGFATSEQFPGEFSDEDIEKELRHKLSEHPEIDLSNLQFNVANQIVQANGTVSSTEDADKLQDVVMNVRGVMGICGQVTVKRNKS